MADRGGNVLFVTLDQLRADVVEGRLAGIAPTPALDRLLREGTWFPQCWTAAVPCGPSRASLLTGLHAFNHRSIRNGTPLARHHATLGTELRKLGREPLLFGYNDIAPDPTGRDLSDPDFRTYELPAAGFREIAELRFEAPMAWIGHLRARGYDVPSPMPERLWELFLPRAEGRAPRPDDPLMIRAEDAESAWLADRALEALDARRDHPWVAHVAFIRPHPPLTAPAPFNRLVRPADVPPPAPAPAVEHPFRRAWFSDRAHHGLWIGFDGDCAGMDAETAAVLRAVYLGLVAEVDAALGRLLDWLDTTGQAERTLVVVMSDHGEMLGDQGYWGKDNVLAPAHRVPLLIRDPRAPGRRETAEVVSSVDVTPTILDWLGAEVPPAMDGVSLVAGRDGPRQGLALTEIDFAEPHRETRFQRAWRLPETACNAAVLRDARWTLVHFNGGLPPMLFDRAEDPDETRDLAPDPAAAGEVARLRAAMLDLRMSRADRRLTGFSFGV